MRVKPLKLFLQLSIVLLCVLYQPISALAQKAEPDSLKKDTTNIYKKLKRYAYKRKFTKFLYQCVFRDPPPVTDLMASNNRSKSNKQKKKDPNAKYVGRIIRKIEIVVYDPFGHSVNDTITRPVSGLQKLGNKAHTTTRTRVIRNLLLFTKNDKIDILKITESERILRQAAYVNDARIHVVPGGTSHDSVDVQVVVLDIWAWEGWLEISSPTELEVDASNLNIGGLGHQFDQSVYHDFSTNESEFRSRYLVSNINRTYISSALTYSKTPSIEQVGLAFNRVFYSPLTKWAGGISGLKKWNYFQYLDVDSVPRRAPVECFEWDYWLGRSFNPRKSNTVDNRSRNIGVAARYFNVQYQDRPSFDIDTSRLNRNSSLYIGSVSYSVRKFYKDKYIYRFGANEDIPEGWLIQGLYGILEKEKEKFRHYLGFEVSRGKHFERFGYITGSLAYGNYFNTEVRNDATINGSVLYFSNLLKAGRWSFRQFFNYRVVYGINKTAIEVIGLNPGEMYGFNGTLLRGSRKMVFTMETVMYSPHTIIGFRFAPVLLIGFGMVDTEQKTFFHTQIYQSYATGFLIRNENLLVSSIKITVGVYPYVVEGATHFKVNPTASFTLRLPGFAMGKPSPVMYQ